MNDDKQHLRDTAEKLGIGRYDRHVFLCTGPTCCTEETGQQTWDVLKKTMKESGLVAPAGNCYRTKVGCLRICCDGPTMVVYPEGVWYHGMTAERIPRFVRQHLVENKPIDEWTFAANPLTADQQSE